MCATSLVEIVQAVVGGSDGCLFCFGHARVGELTFILGSEQTTFKLDGDTHTWQSIHKLSSVTITIYPQNIQFQFMPS